MSAMTRDRLRCGIFLPPFHPNDEDPMLCFERDFELIQWLDKLGFHRSAGSANIIPAATRLTVRLNCSSPPPPSAPSISGLAPGVISLPYHHPMMVADRMVQLDYQTRGRAMFGFGPGLLAVRCHDPRHRPGQAARPDGGVAWRHHAAAGW